MTTTTKPTRRVYQATAKSGVTETYSTVRANRAYDFALVAEYKAMKSSVRVEVPTERVTFCRETGAAVWVPHTCYRTETTWHDHANGDGERIVSFHTTEALAQKALSAELSHASTFAAYIVRTVRIK